MSLDAREEEVNGEIEGRVEERERQIQERERHHKEQAEMYHKEHAEMEAFFLKAERQSTAG